MTSDHVMGVRFPPGAHRLNNMGYLLSYQTVLEVRQDLKGSGNSVALTHGAFDLFHAGHVSFLQESKKHADYLIVGVEADHRIRLYKSESRPIIPLSERLAILLECNSIDFVFIIDEPEFSTEYYSKLYGDISPTVVTYGRTFTGEERIKQKKHDFQYIRFIEVELPLSIDQSTSQIIGRIKNM